MKRVVLTGSECTGKTTLAATLAARLGVRGSAEFSRLYAESVGRVLTAEDVEPIARGQVEIEERVLAHPELLALHDTDLISTVVYARHYYGACPPPVEATARRRRADLYLLCLPDLPWVGDGVRDRGAARARVHGLFTATLREFGCRVVEVAGAGEARVEAALRAIEALRAPPG